MKKAGSQWSEQNHSAWVHSWRREFSGRPLTEFWRHILSGCQVCDWGIQYHLCSTYRGLWGVGGCPAVVAQGQSTGGSTQRCPGFDSRRLPAFFTFLYFCLITSKFIYVGLLWTSIGFTFRCETICADIQRLPSIFATESLCYAAKCLYYWPTLNTISFLNTQQLDGLKSELPAYLTWAAGTDQQFDILEWWKHNASDLPNWSANAKKILLIQPSSAALERVFSLLKNSFGPQQEHALKDYVEA